MVFNCKKTNTWRHFSIPAIPTLPVDEVRFRCERVSSSPAPAVTFYWDDAVSKYDIYRKLSLYNTWAWAHGHMRAKSEPKSYHNLIIIHTYIHTYIHPYIYIYMYSQMVTFPNQICSAIWGWFPDVPHLRWGQMGGATVHIISMYHGIKNTGS